ncbi:MAG: hypothetical protein ICV63_16315 [Coleofasciculus sp. Co-bin14]|nr:hypothetical protein [Coleofasciculus sp. Co-bin14]
MTDERWMKCDRFCKESVGAIANDTIETSITVREWIGTQSFEEQQDFGIRVILAFGGTV